MRKRIEDDEVGRRESGESVNATSNQLVNRNNWKDHQNIQKKTKLYFKEQKDWETIEEDIASLEAALTEPDQDMVEAAINYARLKELMEDKELKKKELEEKMDRWIDLNELVEEIEAHN